MTSYFKYVSIFLVSWLVVVVAIIILLDYIIELDIVSSTAISSVLTIAGMIPLMILSSNLAIKDVYGKEQPK